MNRATYFTGIGSSIAILGAGISLLVLGTINPNYLESIYISNPEIKRAFEYNQISAGLYELVDEMEEHYVSDGKEALVLSNPEKIDMDILPENIKQLADENSQSYSNELFSVYKALEELKSEYSKLDGIEKKLEYGNEYLSVKNQIENLADDIYNDSKKLEPDIEQLLKKCSKFEGITGWLWPIMIVVGGSSAVCFPTITSDMVDWKRKTRNKP